MFNQIGGLNAIGTPMSPNRIGGKKVVPYIDWTGLGMWIVSTWTSAFDGYVDTLLANGFTEITMYSGFYDWDQHATPLNDIIDSTAKGMKVIWGPTSAGITLTAGNWEVDLSSTVDSTADTTHFVDDALTEANDYYNGAYFHNVTRSKGSVILDFDAGTNTITLTTAIAGMTGGDSYTIKGYHRCVLDAAQWAEDNGVFEFKLGNELEYHNDDDTLTDADVITNLKVLATEVQAIYTIGNLNYPCAHDNIDDWISAGKGDIDIISANIYMEYGDHLPIAWKDEIDALFAEFGADGTYIKEFSLHVDGLDNYSEDEAVQAATVTGMIEYIRASGITRALYTGWNLSGFEVLKPDGTYRKLWVSLLGSQRAILQNKLMDKWKAND